MRIGVVGYGAGGRHGHDAGRRRGRSHDHYASSDRARTCARSDRRGSAYVADKPFAPNAEAGRELDRAAKARGINLGVFHNRRWDADVLTLREVLDSGRLGRLWRLHSRMDLDDPNNCAYGEFGRYVSSGSDVQAQAIFAGQRSPDDLVAWGMRRRTSGGR